MMCLLHNKIFIAHKKSDDILSTQRMTLKEEHTNIKLAFDTLITDIQREPSGTLGTTPMPSKTLLLNNDSETFPACLGGFK
jgi:hypothetical protein